MGSLGLLFLTASLLAAVLLIQAMSGCSAAPVEGPPVSVMSASGTGCITVGVYGHPVATCFSETLEDGARCTVVEAISLDGIPLGSGYLPSPLSDPECAEIYRPFRAGVEGPLLDPDGGHDRDPGTDGGGGDTGAAADPSPSAVGDE